MEWQAVKSSQIAKLGYEPEAEYPLGIWFQPNKKQVAAGQQGSVYEYANVTPELFAAFLSAESVGKFFEANIKAHPLTYPYRKVEQGIEGAIADFMDQHGIDTIRAGSAVIKKKA